MGRKQHHGEEDGDRHEDGPGQTQRELTTPSTMAWVCRPMTRKTAFSSRYWIVVQLIRSASRD